MDKIELLHVVGNDFLKLSVSYLKGKMRIVKKICEILQNILDTKIRNKICRIPHKLNGGIKMGNNENC